MTAPRLPPGPKTAGFILELPRFAGGVLPYFAGLSRRYPGPLIHVQVGPGASYIVNHPDTVREMLVQIPERFSRSRWLGELRHLVGTGLLTSGEAEWVPQRRRLRPAYLGRHREAVEVATRDETTAAMARWTPGQTIDVQHEAKRILLRALVRIMMSPDVRVDEQAIIADLDALLQFVSMRTKFVRDNLSLAGIRLRREAALRGVLERLDAFIAAVIEGCRSGELRAGLLLETLLPAEARGEVDPSNLHDELGTLLLAGFDTTAALVTFSLWHLSDRPDLCADVRDEAGQAVTPLTDRVLRETLRLFPAVWAIHRTAAEDIEIGGFRIPRGEHVMACPYALQRNPAFWPEPDRFVPERFAGAPENDALLGLEYLPFSHGRHTCIGKRMAMQQARLMVGQIATGFDMARVGRQPRLIPGVILKAAGGLPLRLTPR